MRTNCHKCVNRNGGVCLKGYTLTKSFKKFYYIGDSPCPEWIHNVTKSGPNFEKNKKLRKSKRRKRVKKIRHDSKINAKIDFLLTQMGVKHICEKSFDGLEGMKGKNLKFDFHLPEHNILIEYNGKQHYVAMDNFGGEDSFIRQFSYDIRKSEWCQLNGINLIEIPYTLESEIEDILLGIANKDEKIINRCKEEHKSLF
jgi:hypothetical protein